MAKIFTHKGKLRKDSLKLAMDGVSRLAERNWANVESTLR